MPMNPGYFGDDPLWYKDAVIYEVPVKSFCDSNDDGIGDFRGLTSKLDYLKELGITAIWLLPFYPSPLKDDGYDIADYTNVHPDYGTLKDFKDFLKAAHNRGLRVITELVLNHTSDQHAWFQKARRAKPGSAAREYYVWSATPEKYQQARIIFKDFETSNWTWDPVAKSYFWHRFYSHQPDLNYENPRVHKAVLKVLDFWLGMGVDGMRLDAVPYLYQREGTNCENLPETHRFLKKLRAHVDQRYKDRMLLAEANQWPEDSVPYFGDGDECHMAFHFPIMPRIFMALWMEDRFPIIDILDQTPIIPDSSQWALFLRNHDELTLEMVSDEERDYMYRIYARDPRARVNLGIRRRLSPLMGNNRRKIELLNILLFSLPGTPIIYYGDEIGMGDNYYLGDRNGVRTPMQWSPDRNGGFSKANPQQLYLPVVIDPEYHYEAVNVENQDRNLSSLLWWTRRVMAVRNRVKAFGRGAIEFLLPNNPKILAFLRKYEEEVVLVVANLSRFSQSVELDLSRFAGAVPVEIFSGNEFPPIREGPYPLTVGFNGYYWLRLKSVEERIAVPDQETLPRLEMGPRWEDLMEGESKRMLEERILPRYLGGSRWFGAKARTIRGIRVIENISVSGPDDAMLVHLLLLEVSYRDGTPEIYSLPVSFAIREDAVRLQTESPRAVICRLLIGAEEGILYDGIYDSRFRELILCLMSRRRKLKGKLGELHAYTGREFRSLLGDKKLPLGSTLLKAEQSNSSFHYENTFIFKLYRRLEEGINPDAEITRFLSEREDRARVASFAGAWEYRREGKPAVTLGLLQKYVQNQGDAWTLTLESAERTFEHILAQREETPVPRCSSTVLQSAELEVPPVLREDIGEFFLEMIRLLGRRTGELHLAISSETADPAFSPEGFSRLYQRSVYQSMRGLVRKTFRSLERNAPGLPEHVQSQAVSILKEEDRILRRMERITQTEIGSMKIRIHGDYHLGQVLFTGKDFVIIDFEGEPARSLGERRLKRSPMRDVAGMLRSIHYASYSAFLNHRALSPEHGGRIEDWVKPFCMVVSGAFLSSYLESTRDAPFVPQTREELEVLLNAFLLEKAIYELDYELNHRPDWVVIPMYGILEILGESE